MIKKKHIKSLFLLVYPTLFFLLTSFNGYSFRELSLPNSVTAYVLEIDPEKYAIFPAHAYGRAIGKQTVQEIAEDHQAFAAINGGFFKSTPDGAPAGILKISDEWFGWPTKPRGAIGWSQNGRFVLFDRLLTQGSVIAANTIFSIQGLNRQPQKSEAVLFSPTFNSTTLTTSDGFEVVIRKNRMIFVREGGNSFIPPDGYILAFGSKQFLPFWKAIERDTPLQLKLEILSQLSPETSMEWDRIPHIVGGTPLLVHEGNAITDFSSEKTLITFIEKAHVRSAVGILRNGNWVFVVAERKQGFQDRGMTIPDLATFMTNLGCYEALNLDGGGSSTLFIQGKVVNHPTGDEDEGFGLNMNRSVSDAIIIKEKGTE